MIEPFSPQPRPPCSDPTPVRGSSIFFPGIFKINLFERQYSREGGEERKRKIFHSLFHSPVATAGRKPEGNWKPGTPSGPTTWMVGAQALGTSSVAFQGPLEGSWIGNRASASVWDASITVIYLPCHSASPLSCTFKTQMHRMPSRVGSGLLSSRLSLYTIWSCHF